MLNIDEQLLQGIPLGALVDPRQYFLDVEPLLFDEGLEHLRPHLRKYIAASSYNVDLHQ